MAPDVQPLDVQVHVGCAVNRSLTQIIHADRSLAWDSRQVV
jgi:hypothetical protein